MMQSSPAARNGNWSFRFPTPSKKQCQSASTYQNGSKEGIVDVLVAAETTGSNLLNTMADFRPVVEAAKGSGVRVYANINSLVDSDRLASGTIEMIRAAATNYWRQGIDGLYLGHWHERWPYTSDLYEIFRELPHPDVMDYRDKIYIMPTESPRRSSLGREGEPSVQLPRTLEVGNPPDIHLHDLRRSAEMGRRGTCPRGRPARHALRACRKSIR